MNLFDLPKKQRDKILMAWGKTEEEYRRDLELEDRTIAPSDDMPDKFTHDLGVEEGTLNVPE